MHDSVTAQDYTAIVNSVCAAVSKNAVEPGCYKSLRTISGLDFLVSITSEEKKLVLAIMCHMMNWVRNISLTMNIEPHNHSSSSLHVLETYVYSSGIISTWYDFLWWWGFALSMTLGLPCILFSVF